MAKNGITAQQVIDAIEGNGYLVDGKPAPTPFVTTLAKRLGVTRRYVYTLLKKFSTAQDALEDQRDAMLDFAEDALMKAVARGNISAIIFLLKTQGKERGYVERQEIAGPDSGPVTLLVKYADDD
jgi:hypothetical protein